MDKEIIKKIKEKITGNIAQYSDSYPKFSNPSYRPFRISENNFHHFAENDSGRKMAFVDGGNMEIVSSPNLSLSLIRSEEHTSELQSQSNLVCRLLLEKKKKNKNTHV